MKKIILILSLCLIFGCVSAISAEDVVKVERSLSVEQLTKYLELDTIQFPVKIANVQKITLYIDTYQNDSTDEILPVKTQVINRIFYPQSLAGNYLIVVDKSNYFNQQIINFKLGYGEKKPVEFFTERKIDLSEYSNPYVYSFYYPEEISLKLNKPIPLLYIIESDSIYNNEEFTDIIKNNETVFVLNALLMDENSYLDLETHQVVSK